MKKLPHIFLILLCAVSAMLPLRSQALSQTRITKEDMLVGQTNWIQDQLSGTDMERNLNLGQRARDVSIKDDFLGTIQNYLFTLVGIVAVGMFIFTGFRLFSARGDEKEYSQAWKAFAYTIIGLVVIPLSFVLVKVVLGFTF